MYYCPLGPIVKDSLMTASMGMKSPNFDRCGAKLGADIVVA